MFKLEKNPRYALIAKYAFGIIALLIVLAALLWRFSAITAFLGMLLSLLSPLVYGAVIAYICNPIVKFFERRLFAFIGRGKAHSPLRRALSLTLTFVLLIGFIALIVLMLVPQIIANYGNLVDSLISFFNTVSDTANGLLHDVEDRFGISIGFELSFATLSEFLVSMGVGGGSLASLPFTILDVAVQALLSVFFAACFLVRKESLCLTLKKLLAAILPKRAYFFVLRALRRTDRTFGRFLVGTLFVSALIGIAVFIVLGAIHLITGNMPYYAVVSVIVAVTNVIPYFGPFLGAIPSAIIIMTDSLPMAVLFCIIILILQQIDGNLITPRVLGHAVGMDSLFIIIAIAVMGGLLGPLGMFIGVPIFAVLYTAVKFIVERRLRRKKLPTRTAAYEGVFSGHDTFGAFPVPPSASPCTDVSDRTDPADASKIAVQDASPQSAEEVNA